MGIFLTLIAGLVLWVVLWGTSLMKSFDAFLLGMLLVLLQPRPTSRGRTCPAGVVKPALRSVLRLISAPLSGRRSAAGRSRLLPPDQGVRRIAARIRAS